MKSVDVEIFGGSYSVKGDADPEYVRQLARYVDDKMRILARKSPYTSTPHKIAVLAAINIADELFKLKRHNRDIEDIFHKKTGDLIDALGGEEMFRQKTSPDLFDVLGEK